MRRSRAGFVVCPGCLSHARLPVAGGSANCGFCGTPLRSDGLAADNAALGRTAANSRTGVLLASLLGVSLAACGSDDETVPDTDAISDVAEDTGADGQNDLQDEIIPDALYGLPPDVVEDVAEDVIPGPEYGLPADVEDDIQEDVPPVDAYGLPADVVEDIAEDVIPGPEYGLPADVEDDTDGDASDADAATDGSAEADVPDLPAYGLPPSPDEK